MNNIENKIKKALQQRKIQPSNMSWDRLTEKLESQNKEKTKNKFIYYRIAVVFIGLLVGFTFLLNKKKDQESLNATTDMVATKKVKTPTINETVKEEIVKNNTNDVVFSSPEKKIKNKSKINFNQKKTATKNSIIQKVLNKKQLQIANTVVVNNIDVSTSNSVNNKEKSTNITQSIQQNENLQIAVLASKSELADVISKSIIDNKVAKKDRILMNSSDADIDNMLANAIGERKITNKELHIQSNKLKYAVENQLNRESKNRMYYLIKSGVDTVESIIVSNNN
jgi:hypothetical protein